MSFSSFLSSKLENDVRKLASGDIDALHGIYEQTKDSVFVFCLAKTREPHESRGRHAGNLSAHSKMRRILRRGNECPRMDIRHLPQYLPRYA